jgi:hypothetical protein
MFKIATVHLGISVFDFYEMTYREIDLMLEEKYRKHKDDMETLVSVVRVGYINARTGKNYKLYDDEGELQENFIDPAEKEKTLKELKSEFSK